MKKRIAIVISALSALSVSAWILIVIGCLVLVSGAVAVGTFVTHIHRWLPPDDQHTYTTNVVYVWVGTNQIGVTNVFTNTPAMMIAPAQAYDGATFTLQYGITADSAAWLSAGETVPNSDVLEITSVLDDEDTNYVCTFAALGDTWLYHAWPDGDEATLLDPRRTVVVERTADFVVWTPVFTNAFVATNTVSAWTDSNAPTEKAFYRIRQ